MMSEFDGDGNGMRVYSINPFDVVLFLFVCFDFSRFNYRFKTKKTVS